MDLVGLLGFYWHKSNILLTGIDRFLLGPLTADPRHMCFGEQLRQESHLSKPWSEPDHQVHLVEAPLVWWWELLGCTPVKPAGIWRVCIPGVSGSMKKSVVRKGHPWRASLGVLQRRVIGDTSFQFSDVSCGSFLTIPFRYWLALSAFLEDCGLQAQWGWYLIPSALEADWTMVATEEGPLSPEVTLGDQIEGWFPLGVCWLLQLPYQSMWGMPPCTLWRCQEAWGGICIPCRVASGWNPTANLLLGTILASLLVGLIVTNRQPGGCYICAGGARIICWIIWESFLPWNVLEMRVREASSPKWMESWRALTSFHWRFWGLAKIPSNKHHLLSSREKFFLFVQALSFSVYLGCGSGRGLGMRAPCREGCLIGSLTWVSLPCIISESPFLGPVQWPTATSLGWCVASSMWVMWVAYLMGVFLEVRDSLFAQMVV